MKFNKFITSMIVTTMCLIIGGASQVKAEEYGVSDIERMYINCETDINALTKEDYVSAEITVVKKDGTVDMQDLEGQVKLRGNSTSKAEKRPVNIKLSSKQSILGMEKGKKWCVLANAFDKSLIRNALSFDLADKMGLSYISQRRFIDLYYNDKFIGSYLVTEPVDPGSNLVDIEEEGDDFMLEVERERQEADVTYIKTRNGIRFAINVPEEPSNEQLTAIKTKVNQIETALKTYNYDEYSKYIDVNSFVNYYIVSEIFKPVDFNYSSTRFYMKDGVLYAGPVWDVDLSSGNAASRFYTGYYNGGVSYKDLFCQELKWYNYLFKSAKFKELVSARFEEMLPTIQNMYQTNSLGTNIIDGLMETYKPSFLRNYAATEDGGAGWKLTFRYSTCDNPIGLEYDSPSSTYEGNVEFLRTWLQNRVNYLQTQLVVESNNDSNNGNNNSNEEQTTTAPTQNKVSAVTDLKIKKATKVKVYLSWVNKGTADGIEVYVKTKGGNYELVKTITGGSVNTYTVKNIKPGVKYYFTVRSYVINGGKKVYSEYSNIVTQKNKLKAPKLKIKKKGKKVSLKWNKVSGVDGYIVYRVTKKGKLKKVATLKGSSKKKYTIKKIKANTKTYKVKAYVKVNGKRILSK